MGGSPEILVSDEELVAHLKHGYKLNVETPSLSDEEWRFTQEEIDLIGHIPNTDKSLFRRLMTKVTRALGLQ